jgi:hypothetical protein
MSNQENPEIAPEELVRQRQKAAKESSKFWATRSAEDLSREIEPSLFNTGEQWQK